MGEISVLNILILGHALHSAAAVFFHESSSVRIQSHEPVEHSDFGFSMAYQTAKYNLVVGAPSADSQGKIYSCEMRIVADVDQVNCEENVIEVEDAKEFSRDINPSQNFYMGAPIATTPDYLFTCAPLWTANVKSKSSGGVMSDAFGTCFIRNNTDSYRYKGTLDRYIKQWNQKITNLQTFVGGTGWSVLLDEENDLLLIAKATLKGDFMYTMASKPLKSTKSLIVDSTSWNPRSYLEGYENIGYGITAGKFFSRDKTMYAFSLETPNMGGAISFLEYDSKRRLLSLYGGKVPHKLESKAVNTMFGSALGAADLNMDGLDELLVGAPAYSEDECAECGALHIYLGGKVETMDFKNRLRTILSRKEFSRFGSAITNADLDGDSIPELVVSAPYEDLGLGAIYILSGYEIQRDLIKIKTFKQILLSDLKFTQRVQKQPYRTLGYSLQFIDDADNNGCRELAVGAPGDAKVLLFKCIAAINVTVHNELIGDQLVREQDNNFTVNVCVRVQQHELPYEIIGNISVVTSIIGEATNIPDPKFSFDISCSNCTQDRDLCQNVTVVLSDNERRDYMFTSNATLHTEHIFNSTELNNTWVSPSLHSNLVKSIEVPRHCRGDDCIPKLSVEAFWSGNDSYVPGSSVNETVTIRVRNEGNASYEACAWLRVRGARITRLDCGADSDGYRCYLPKPMRRYSEYSVKLALNMTKPTNFEKELVVEVLLYENCNRRSVVNGQSRIRIPYVFPTDDIYVNGTSTYKNVTDRQILDTEFIHDDQEYQITNNGSVMWYHVRAIITMEKRSFINVTEISAIESGTCANKHTSDLFYFNCALNVMPYSTRKITVTTKMVASELSKHFKESKLNMTSQLQVYLWPAREIKNASVQTEVTFVKALTLANNKLMIALLALLLAILILGILIFVLWKYGFFRREKKEKLQVMRESIRRRSSRRATQASETTDGNVAGLQMDVDEDPFDEVPIPVTSNDNATLVETNHNH